MKILRRIAVGVTTVLLLLQLPRSVSGEEVNLHMDVGSLYQKKASFSVGKTHSWFVRFPMPDQWEDILELTVLQTLSPALTLDPESFSMKLLQPDGGQTLLRMEEHYTLTAGSVHVEEGIANRFCAGLTPEGIHFLKEYGSSESELVLRYRTKINTCAEMGRQILGVAQLNVTDTEGEKRVFFSDKAWAATGGFRFRFTDTEGKPVEGSIFMLAREATPEEIQDGLTETELLDTGEETICVVYERFFTPENMPAAQTHMLTTDRDGYAGGCGLAYGMYYLVQTEIGLQNGVYTPPVKLIINEASHLSAQDGWKDGSGRPADNTVRITGISFVMPQTGGPGTGAYTVSGLLIIGCACLLLWYNRKRALF